MFVVKVRKITCAVSEYYPLQLRTNSGSDFWDYLSEMVLHCQVSSRAALNRCYLSFQEMLLLYTFCQSVNDAVILHDRGYYNFFSFI